MDPSSSQTLRALLSLRELILSGALEPGERVSELPLVERLGVSRTPLRAALVRLEQEGLLEAIPTGGFAVRGFDERDLYTAIEVRGTLEGLAARLAAERGLSAQDLAALGGCVAALDALLARSPVTTRNFSDYVRSTSASTPAWWSSRTARSWPGRSNAPSACRSRRRAPS